jgi:hypothetical protein
MGDLGCDVETIGAAPGGTPARVSEYPEISCRIILGEGIFRLTALGQPG